jgi:hypothetical protein
MKVYKVLWKPWGPRGSSTIVIDPPVWCGVVRTLFAKDVEIPFLGGEAP